MAEKRKIMFFCLGNICRSPLAHALFEHKTSNRGLADHFEVESSGTGAYHVGETPDVGSQRVAKERLDLDISDQRAQQLKENHIEKFDYLVAMDRRNMQRAIDLKPEHADKIQLIRDFEPEPLDRRSDVPDPYGGAQDRFGEVYDILDRCLDEFIDYLVEREQLQSK